MGKNVRVGITGHRDIIITENLKKGLKSFFIGLIEENRSAEIELLSPLADGADRLVANIFLELKNSFPNLKLIVPMPFKFDRYLKDFDNSSKEVFLEIVEQKADVVFEVPKLTNCGYANVGRYVANNSNILLALWDGTFNNKAGGTGDIVNYAKSKDIEVVHFKCIRADD